MRDSDKWRQIVSHRAFRSTYTLVGESLKRVPSRFDADHPLAADLKRKDFIVSSPLDDREVMSEWLLPSVVARYKTALPFMRFLADALAI